jgi:preprotein translocase subunit YajC
MKPLVKITLFVVLFIVIVIIGAAIYLFYERPADLAKEKPQYTVTAEQLQKEFDVDEASASSKYTDKIIEVSGTIASVKNEENNKINISLKTDSDFSSVICAFNSLDDPSKFHAGDHITLRGECSGFLLDVLLKDCVIIGNNK